MGGSVAFSLMVLLMGLHTPTCSGYVTNSLSIFVFTFKSAKHSIYSESRILPALEIARETISHRVQRREYANFTLRWVYSFHGCSHGIQHAVGEAAQLYFEEDVVAYIGPPCSNPISSVADFAAAKGIPIFSGSAGSSELDNKVRYPTLTQTVFKPSTMASFLRGLFYKYDWNSCVVINSGHLYLRPALEIEAVLFEAGVRIFYRRFQTDSDLDIILEEASLNSRG